MNKKSVLTIFLIVFSLVCLLLIRCTEEESSTLAPYQGDRPLKMLKVTKNFVPEIQWLGGRVAAVGVNQGGLAALDASLVWLTTTEGNTINSAVKFATNTDTEKILQYGGTPLDSLQDQTEYTFWIAEKALFDAGLDSILFTEYNFARVSQTTNLVFLGRPGGEKGNGGDLVVTVTVFREETLRKDKFIIDWEPKDIPFRRIAINEGVVGGWTDLLWHVVLPDSLPDNIYPPVVIGAAPEGTFEANKWPESGFEIGHFYMVWMANEKWTESDFGRSATGYAYYQIFQILDL